MIFQGNCGPLVWHPKGADGNYLNLLAGDDMDGGVKCGCPVPGDIRFEEQFSLLQYAGDLRLGQDNIHDRQPPPEVGFDHDTSAGKPRPALSSPDLDRRDPGFLEQGYEFQAVSEHEGQTQGVGCRPASRSSSAPSAA